MNESINSGLSNWLVNSAKRNPEGALLLAAGAVLLLRQTGAAAAVGNLEVAQNAAGAIRQTASNAKQYAGELVEKASDSAKDFGSDIQNKAQNTKDAFTKQAYSAAETAQSSIKSAVEKVVKEQPLLIALAGVAAGAGLAAVFPVSTMEREALEPVGKHVNDAVQYARDEAKEALGRAGDKLTEVAHEKGLTSEGIKRMATDVVSAAGNAAASSSKAGGPR